MYIYIYIYLFYIMLSYSFQILIGNLNYKTSHWECAHTIDTVDGLLFIFATYAEFSYMFILGIF